MNMLRLAVVALLAVGLSGCDGETIIDVFDLGPRPDLGPLPDLGPPAPDQGGDPLSDLGPPAGSFVVDFETSVGVISVRVRPDWAPLGAARVRELVVAGYYDDSRFFRVLPNFVAQYGLAGTPEVIETWWNRRIQDDPVVASNVRGTLTFATAGADTRTTQLFINYGDNSGLDRQGFAPVGEIIDGTMANADSINAQYGEQPSQGIIRAQGNEYLDSEFPGLTAIRRATIRP